MSYKKNNYRYNYKNKNNSYNYTSVAYDYEKPYKASPKINRRIKKVKKERYIKAEQGLKIFSLKFFITLIILTSFIISIIFIEALFVQKKFEIQALKETLKEKTEDNKNLETEIMKNLDLEYIENVASFELDMQKPSPYQIVHIDVPKESYSEKGMLKSENNFMEKIINLFKN